MHAQFLRALVASVMLIVAGCAGHATADGSAVFVATTGHDVHVTVIPSTDIDQTNGLPADVIALLGFVDSGQFEALAQAAGPLPAYQETNVIHLFRNDGPRFVLPDIGLGCAPNASCLGSAPPLTLLTSFSIDATPIATLVTGQASVSSTLVQRSGDLPRTDWSFLEPVSDVRWSGIIQTPSFPDQLIFTASLVQPEMQLTSGERGDIARSLADFISTYLGE
jgi:hypothetical protein